MSDTTQPAEGTAPEPASTPESANTPEPAAAAVPPAPAPVWAAPPQAVPPQAAQPQQPSGAQPGQPAPAAQPYAGYPTAPAAPRALSITSMSLGIAGIVLGWMIPLLPSIAAVITGHLAQRREPAGRAFWLTGLITGYVGIALAALGLVLVIIWIAFVYSSVGVYGTYS